MAVVDQHPGKIEIVVTDIVMPRMGGPQLVEKLKEKRNEFAVIFMSGYTETAALENAKIGRDAIFAQQAIFDRGAGPPYQRSSRENEWNAAESTGRIQLRMRDTS